MSDADLHCLICGGGSFISLPYYYEFRGRIIRIVRCACCSLVTLYPMPSQDEINSLYTEEYFQSEYHCGTSKGSYTSEIVTMKRAFLPHLRSIRRFRPSGRYLEVGCAGGAELQVAKEHDYEVLGVELNAEMASWGRENLGLDIRQGTLQDQAFPSSFFDVVYLGDVIEHILRPLDLLAEIHRILKPAGVIALAYPMEMNHLVPRLRTLLRLDFKSPHYPYHVFSYNNLSMRALLTKAGYTIRWQKTDKLVRMSGLATGALDSINFALTRVSGRFGDRGFTIAEIRRNGNEK